MLAEHVPNPIFEPPVPHKTECGDTQHSGGGGSRSEPKVILGYTGNSKPVLSQNKTKHTAQLRPPSYFYMRSKRKGLGQRKLLSKPRAESRFSTSVLDHIDPISVGVGVSGSL